MQAPDELEAALQDFTVAEQKDYRLQVCHYRGSQGKLPCFRKLLASANFKWKRAGLIVEVQGVEPTRVQSFLFALFQPCLCICHFWVAGDTAACCAGISRHAECSARPSRYMPIQISCASDAGMPSPGCCIP